MNRVWWGGAVAVAALVALGGNSRAVSEWTASTWAEPAGRGGETVSAAVTAQAAPRPMRARAAGIADAPDRGSLLAYVPRSAHREGAYTWRRIQLSEAHALRAIGAGSIAITTPSGERLSFRYQRHVEHESGDWTWIGTLEDGQSSEQAIITFGAKAVFGNIAQPGHPSLRLTVRDGASWLVETDAAAISQLDIPATRPRVPDFLVPPRSPVPARDGLSTGGAPAMAAAAVQAQAVTTSTVDLLLGYTSGFATGLGGTSQALTRLNNLVDITNQGYINSQLSARVRLVRAMEVNYPDATDHSTALEELTGYRNGVGSIAPAAAFTALRAAREQYGADVVSLVRKFNTPENAGCGIAWLIGSDLGTIDRSQEGFGYSIVADGVDAGNDGKSYYCRDETLAHELGHNMGSQHDQATATSETGSLEYGVYAYSFGHKQTGPGGFYTIMAYGDTGLTNVRTFSNPRTLFCNSAPCGVEGVADNARSLTQTIPIIATFRNTVVPMSAGPARNDVDGDGKSDTLWFDGLSFSYWIMNGVNLNPVCCVYLGPGFRPVAASDMSGDGRVDLIWKGAGGDMHLWTSTGTGFRYEQLPFNYPAGWTLFAAEDMNGDGKADLFWSDGINLSYWIMDVRTYTRLAGQPVGAGYVPLAVRDFTGDGMADILWKGSAGDMHLWSSTGTAFAGRQLPWNFPAGWKLVATGDINGDRKADLMWYDGKTLVYWIMDGTNPVASGALSVVNFTLSSAADYTGDGLVDLIWKGAAGDMHLWRSNGAGFVGQQFAINYPGGWSAIGGNP